jgi:hypothetical protein
MGGKSDKGPIKPTAAVRQDEDGPGPAADGPLQDWTYHGIGPIISPDDRAHILVESTVFGPAERQNAAALRELPEPPYGGFYWGTTEAAQAGQRPRSWPAR